LLDIQELYKKETGEYFAIDVYGSGPDERAIQRAFFGRKGILDTSPKDITTGGESTPDRTAAGFFRKTSSLREQLFTKLSSPTNAASSAPRSPEATDVETQQQQQAPTIPATPILEPEVIQHQPIEVVWDQTASVEGVGIDSPKGDTATLAETEYPNRFVILSDLSREFMGTTVTASQAGTKVGQDIVGLGVHAFATEEASGSSSASSSSNIEDNASTSFLSQEE
jgi:hypothetical protein